MGQMFRHERPQKGRYRQFHQLGVEAYGMVGPDIDAELILLSYRLWRDLGIDHQLRLEINSLGTSEERSRYRERLVVYFRQHLEVLDEESLRRLETNPLRILDSKNPDLRAIIAGAPSLIEELQEESRAHFEGLLSRLDRLGLPYVVNPRLVRGLDYYSRTVFEWVTDALGAQGTVCAGGRYDGLVEQLGGKESTAVGFALGMERLIELLSNPEALDAAADPDVYLIAVGDQAEALALMLAERLRDELPTLRLQMNCGGGSFKSQFKRADKSGARWALILGETEILEGTIGVKSLRGESEQAVLAVGDVSSHLTSLLQR